MKNKLLVIFFIVLSIGLMYQLLNKNEKTDNINMISKNLDTISIEQFEEMKVNKETCYIYVARPACSDCQIFDRQFLKELKTNKSLQSIKYLDISTIHIDKNKWKMFKNQNRIEGTPSFIHIKNGKIKDTYGWTLESSVSFHDFLLWFAKNTETNDMK